MRILLVEDTEDVGEAVVGAFERMGHAVDWQKTHAGSMDALAVQDYALVVLDVNLPDGSGFDILASLRAKRIETPVLVLTARALVDDRVDALDTGADDYLVKPFDFRELEARARALLRRSKGSGSATLSVGDVSLDPKTRTVTLSGHPVELTRREIALLEVMMGQPGRVFSKSELLDQLYGFESDAGPNAIELYIGRLRKKLANAKTQILTLRGMGYQIMAPRGTGR
ncbi:response regulator transcription factor [Pelagibacterium halotolerans]|uniref:response regulator transcription factor n=1 Tax=Pelagibacterium halotolerans TaxID=531813 RepID=UPI00059FBDE2|nr:response regulator transcription factor [Pelagibacterium halotolerans]QJR20051.1 response regulator transcription factor [Pelagibacterium halotolerans]